MGYLQMMKRVVAGDDGVYAELAASGRLFGFSMVNLGVLGLLYGMTSAGLSRMVLARLDSGAGFSPMAVAIVGLLVVYLVHGSAVLFIWVFCRALGGNQRLAPHYLNMGVAGIALWPVAPAAACLQAGVGGAALMVATGLAGLWGAIAMFVAAKAASGLSHAKMGIAVIATLIYAGCFLYLWI